MRLLLICVSLVVAAATWPSPAAALTREQARERCIAQLKPIVRACVRKRTSAQGGQPSQYLEECKASIRPRFQTCMASAMGRTGSGSAAGRSGGRKACTFQACFDRCHHTGGPRGGSSLTTRHCANQCTRRCG